jgi:ankyrin repeat protein
VFKQFGKLLAAVLLLWFIGNRILKYREMAQVNARLLTAVKVGDRVGVLDAMELGASADTKDDHQSSVLMLAAARGDIDIVRTLLDSGAKAGVRDQHGRTALMWATASGNATLAALLIFWRSDLNARSDDGMTALKLARLLAAGKSLPSGWSIPQQLQSRQYAVIAQMLESAGAQE